MARTDDDTWDLATSVGATATVVAAARALAGRQGDPLVNDPFAEPLVRAVGIARSPAHWTATTTCRPRPRTGCSTPSPRSRHRVAGSPPNTTPTAGRASPGGRHR